MAFWTCPSCGRKVPSYSSVCHCGVAETASTALPAPPPLGVVRFSWRELPRPVWVAIGVIAVALGFGVWQLFRPSPPERMVPLLGVIQRRPTPVPTSTPTPKPKPSPSPSPSPSRTR